MLSQSKTSPHILTISDEGIMVDFIIWFVFIMIVITWPFPKLLITALYKDIKDLFKTNN